MPRHLFWNCRHLDYSTAVRADTSKQNYSVCPRYWYVDATICCCECQNDFCFVATDQKLWYENHRFWIDSFPKHCKECRSKIRRRKSLQRDYDLGIRNAIQASDIEQKTMMIEIVDELQTLVARLPAGMVQSRSLLMEQLAKLTPGN